MALARQEQKSKAWKRRLDIDIAPHWDAEGYCRSMARSGDGGYLSALEEEDVPMVGIDCGVFGSRTAICSLSSPKGNGVLFIG